MPKACRARRRAPGPSRRRLERAALPAHAGHACSIGRWALGKAHRVPGRTHGRCARRIRPAPPLQVPVGPQAASMETIETASSRATDPAGPTPQARWAADQACVGQVSSRTAARHRGPADLGGPGQWWAITRPAQSSARVGDVRSSESSWARAVEPWAWSWLGRPTPPPGLRPHCPRGGSRPTTALPMEETRCGNVRRGKCSPVCGQCARGPPRRPWSRQFCARHDRRRPRPHFHLLR